ncbi:hypothetical protein VQ02_33770 [Methylobacterium variabile]|uniref:Uncharacterized protein n=1 Tax=Methylobacterium variabile TaxID=298794 RepID=A0A0J6S0H1_9HYPH|nr:hypothetical protein VQ02_33770 [Methylobacterium variabile]
MEPFTVRSLAEKTGVRERTVSGYVTALFRANIIRQIDPPTMTQQGTLPAVYRAARVLGPLPPLIRYAAPGRPANDPNLLAPVRS